MKNEPRFGRLFFRTGGLALVFFFFQNDFFGQTTWQKMYGGAGDERARWCIFGNDPNEIVVAGQAESGSSGGQDGLVMKIDATGQEKWTTLLGGTGQEEFLGIVRSKTGSGYLVCGFSSTNSQGGDDAFLAKLSETGQVLWQKKWGTQSQDRLTQIHQLPDGYAVCGSTKPGNFGGSESLFFKIDENGGLIWANIYGGSDEELFGGLQFLPNGNWRLIGAGGDGAAIYEMKPTGEIVSSRRFFGPGLEAFYFLEPLADGSAYICDHSWSFGGGSVLQQWLAKIDQNGQLLWSKTYSSAGHLWRGPFSRLADGDLLLTPQDNGLQANSDGVLIRTDAEGQPKWAKKYGGDAGDRIFRAIQMPDGGFLAVGETKSFGTGANVWVIRTDSNGEIADCCIENQMLDVQAITPSTATFSINSEPINSISNSSQTVSGPIFSLPFSACQSPMVEANFSLSDTSICLGDCIFPKNEAIQSGVEYEWTFENGQPLGSTDAQPDSVCFFEKGDFKITLRASNGECSAEKMALVHVGDEAAISVDSIKICPFDSVFLKNEWRKPPTVVLDTTQAAGGCLKIQKTIVGLLPDSMATDSVALCEGDSIFFENRWIREPMAVSSIEISEKGCVLERTTLFFRPATGCPTRCRIFWPNVFSPNDDGKNDRWFPAFDCELENFDLKIFDRWGELVWQTDDPKSAGWDGFFRAKKMDNAVFAFVCQFDFVEARNGPTRRFLKKGDVTLAR